jgi:hypothetical protein
VKEYDLYVPLTYNDGTPVEPETIERIGLRLLEEFGVGLPQPASLTLLSLGLAAAAGLAWQRRRAI